jgi:hypothetical protein
VTIRVRLTSEQAQQCEQAASKHGLTVPAWAAHILEHAAGGISTDQTPRPVKSVKPETCRSRMALRAPIPHLRASPPSYHRPG